MPGPVQNRAVIPDKFPVGSGKTWISCPACCPTSWPFFVSLSLKPEWTRCLSSNYLSLHPCSGVPLDRPSQVTQYSECILWEVCTFEGTCISQELWEELCKTGRAKSGGILNEMISTTSGCSLGFECSISPGRPRDSDSELALILEVYTIYLWAVISIIRLVVGEQVFEHCDCC